MAEVPQGFVPDVPDGFVPDDQPKELPPGQRPYPEDADISANPASFEPTMPPGPMFKSFLPLPEPIRGESLPGQAGAALANFGIGTSGSILSPGGLATLPIGLLGRIGAAAGGLGFGLPAIKEGLHRVYSGAALMDPQEAMEGALQTGTGGLITMGGIKGALARGEVPTAEARPEVATPTPEGFEPDVAATPPETPPTPQTPAVPEVTPQNVPILEQTDTGLTPIEKGPSNAIVERNQQVDVQSQREGNVRGGTPAETSPGGSVPNEANAGQGEAQAPENVAAKFKLVPTDSKDGVIEGDGGRFTVRAPTAEEADGTHSVDSLTVFSPPGILDPRIAPRATIDLAEKITGASPEEARQKAYQALTDEINKGNFDIFKKSEKPKQLTQPQNVTPEVTENPALAAEPPPTETPRSKLDAVKAKLASAEARGRTDTDAYRKLTSQFVKLSGDAAKEETGQSVEPAAQQVEQQVEKVVATEGQRPAKDVKSELVDRLQNAIKDAPAEDDVIQKTATKPNGKVYVSQPDTRTKVTIDIPGDGTFTVWNTKENLTELLSRAKSISTKANDPMRIKKRGISAEDRDWIDNQLRQEGSPISVGPGAASPGDTPLTPPQAIAAGAAIEKASPVDRPFGKFSSVSAGLNNAREAIANIGTTLKGIAGESLPRITAANREVGEAGVRYASSRIAAKPLAQTFAAKVLQGTDVDPVKFGAALTEDNLRSVREGLRQQATEALAEGKGDLYKSYTDQADKVATIVGSKGSPFPTEDAYFDYLKEPNVQQAVKQHIQMWQETIDPQYRAAMDLDPDTPLPTRGQQTGARVNLKAVFPEDPAANPIRGMVGSNLTGTFKKKTPFGIRAKGTGETYDVNYNNLIQNTFERQLEIANKNKFDDMLVASGNAVIDKPGRQIMIDGKPAVGFPLSRKVIVATGKGETQAFSRAQNIYVKQGLANEYEAASGVGTKYRIPVVTKLMNVINRAALAGLTDATVHVSNQMTALFDRPVSGKLLTDSLLSATGRADVPVTILKTLKKAMGDNREQIAELSKIGAMRPQDIHYGMFSRMLQASDRVTRLTLDDTFKSLVKEGLVENTETARREYVNQIGQYNRRLQGKWTKLFRDSGLGPFVTAGKTFNALGVRMATMDPGAPGANAFAAAALRANIMSKWVGAATLLGTMNYLMTHKLKNGGIMGRPGTPLGNLDLGTNDKSGKQQSFPLFSVLGLGRGLRVTGISGAVNAKRLGLTNADAAESASRDIINAWTAPYAGPPVKFGAIAATGYPPAVEVGRTSRVVPPGSNQRLENVKEAVRQANPIVQTAIKAKEGKPLSEIVASQIPRFTLNPGKTESMVEKYPKIVSMAQGGAFIDDMIHQARQLPKDQRHAFVNEQVQRLPATQQAHARSEAVRRRVYTN